MKLTICAKDFLQVAVFSCVVLINSYCAAQNSDHERYVGFKTSFGSQNFNLVSDVEEIHGLRASFTGGSIGVVNGNEIIRGAFNVAGFYYSSDNTPRTIDLVYSDVTLSFYPLGFTNRNFQLQPYVSAGLALSRLKFYGHYASQDPTKRINYSAPEPYLGKQKTFSALLSVGFEYRFPAYEFLSVFAEATVSRPFAGSADRLFQKTSIDNVTAIHIGVAFGSIK